MSVLAEICDKKRTHIAAQKTKTSLEELKARCAKQSAPRGFIKALRNANGPALIAEVKKASPSKGLIRPDFDAVEISQIYEQNGADCISVLTDAPYFQGADEYLQAVRDSVALPLLRKDFMIDPYQIYESRALGADCILLIMAALEDSQATDLYALCEELGMDVLIEVHDELELKRALELNPQMIGINNRNLKTLEVNIQTSLELFELIPNHILRVSESGIGSYDTLMDLHQHGFEAFLIGESLTRQSDIKSALQKLLHG